MVRVLFLQIVVVIECEVMCNTGSDCALSIKAFIMPHAVYRVYKYKHAHIAPE